MIDVDYSTYDPMYDESYLEEDYTLDSELECQKIDMGVYDDDGESFIAFDD